MAMTTIGDRERSPYPSVLKFSRKRLVKTTVDGESSRPNHHTAAQRQPARACCAETEWSVRTDLSRIARTRIARVLASLGEIDATNIDIDVHNQAVTLRGQVRCWSERAIVEQVAWATPTVLTVRNDLAVAY
jgi:hypothetical protein